jgi:hypothetical protein
MSVTKIENNTDRAFILLPPTESHPQGVRLLPGLNSVPDLYLEELEAITRRKADVMSPDGKTVKGALWHPGQRELARLQKPVRIDKADGTRTGPQITIYPKGSVQDQMPDGLPPPHDLQPYREPAALMFIEQCKDADALKRWVKDDRKTVAKAASQRLAGL